MSELEVMLSDEYDGFFLMLEMFFVVGIGFVVVGVECYWWEVDFLDLIFD